MIKKLTLLIGLVIGSAFGATHNVTCVAGVGALADAQAAVDLAVGGDTVLLEADCDFLPIGTLQFKKDPGTMVYVMSSEWAKLPTSTYLPYETLGGRVNPSQIPLMPRFYAPTDASPAIHFLSGFESSTTSAGVPARHYYLRGIAVIVDAGTNPTYDMGEAGGSGVIRIGDGGTRGAMPTTIATTYRVTGVTVTGEVGKVTHAGNTPLRVGDKIRLENLSDPSVEGVKTITSVSGVDAFFDATGIVDGNYTGTEAWWAQPADETQIPDDIVIDQVVSVNLGDLHIGVIRDIYLNSSNTIIKNSWLGAAKSARQANPKDNQNILIVSAGVGNKIIGNTLSSPVSENIMFGGSQSYLPTFVHDFEVAWNYIAKPPGRSRTRTWQVLKDTDQPEWVLKGYIVRGDSSAAGHFIALNTGKLGTTRPTFTTTCTTANCTISEDAGAGATPVVWKRIETARTDVASAIPNIKNLLEIKRAYNGRIHHNHFRYMPWATQDALLNIKNTNESLYPDFENFCTPTLRLRVNASGNTVTYVSGGIFPRMISVNPSKQLTANSTVNLTTGMITWTQLNPLTHPHGMNSATLTGRRFYFFGTDLPAGFSTQTTYYGVGCNGTLGCQFSLTPGGAVIVPTTAGTDTWISTPDTLGDIVKINGVWYRVASFDSDTQLTTVETIVGGPLTDVQMDYGAEPVARRCQYGITRYITVDSNVFQDMYKWLAHTPGVSNAMNNSTFTTNGDVTLRNNLIFGVDANLWNNSLNNTGGTTSLLFSNPPMARFTVEHNTMIGNSSNVQWGMYIDTSGAAAPGNTVVRYNIWNKMSFGAHRSNYTDLRNHLAGGTNPPPESQFGKNIFVGASLTTYSFVNSAQTENKATYNLCTVAGVASSSACTESATTTGFKYSNLFTNFSLGKYAVRNTSAFKRTAAGADYGADLSTIPSLNVTVTPKDKTVNFKMKVGATHANLPCDVMVATLPDYETFVAELSDPATYPRRGYADHPLNSMNGTEQEITLGASVNLTASTKYYYHLTCGPMVAEGNFTTTGAVVGTETRRPSKTIAHASTQSVVLEYGTAKAGTVISGGGAVTVNATGVRTTVQIPFTADKGIPYFFRFLEKSAVDGGGTTLNTTQVWTSIQ